MTHTQRVLKVVSIRGHIVPAKVVGRYFCGIRMPANENIVLCISSIYKDMDSKEKRKIYMREYRIRNRDSIYKYWRENYYRKNRERLGVKKSDDRFFEETGMYGKSGFGRKYELKALKILPGSVDKNDSSFQGKWDIEWEGKKINVKARTLKFRKGSKVGYYQFCKYGTAEGVTDYMLFCIDKEGHIEKVLMVDSDDFGAGLYVKSGDHDSTDKYKVIWW